MAVNPPGNINAVIQIHLGMDLAVIIAFLKKIIVCYLGIPHFLAKNILNFLGIALLCIKDLPSRCSISC